MNSCSFFCSPDPNIFVCSCCLSCMPVDAGFDVQGDHDDMNQDPSAQHNLLIQSDALLSATSTPTYFPSNAPPESTSQLTHEPTAHPTNPPSPRPTPEDTTIVFYVMADAPYTDYEREEVMPDVIQTLPNDAELLFHLGDLEYKKEDNCEEWAYKAASTALRKSPVPTFVLPGDNDLNGEFLLMCNS